MAASILLCALKNGFSMKAADPKYQLESYGRHVPWDDQFVAEMRRGLMACRVL